MRNVKTNFLKATNQVQPSKVMLLLDGNVEIADIFTLEKKLRKYVLYVLIQRHILKEK